MAFASFRRKGPEPQEPLAALPKDSEFGLRERIFSYITQATSIAALPVVIANTNSAIAQGDYPQAFAYLGIYLLLLGAAFGRRLLPFNVRVWGLLALLWGAAFASYRITGVRGDGRIWLMGAVIVSGLLLDGAQALAGILLSLGVHGLVGWLILQGWLPPPPVEELVHSALPKAWVNTGITLSAVGLTSGAITYILRGRLENALEESQQLTLALENERRRLEKQERDLQRRVAQLRTASEISRVAATLLDPQRLMEYAVNKIQESFDLYYVGIFLLDERGEYAVLHAGTGEAGQRMLQEGHRLAVGGTSMIGWCIANRKRRLALDVGEEPVRFNNPHLPHTRTELALPLIVRGDPIGAMTIQSDRPQAFDEDDVRILQSIADTIASALANARLFRTTQETLQELQTLHAQFLAQAWSDLPVEGLQVVEGEQQASGPGLTDRLLRLPLRVRETTVGEVLLERERPWSPEEETLAQALVDQAGWALENAGLLTESLRRAAQEQILGQISAQVSTTLDFDAMLRTTLRELQRHLDIQEAEIRLLPPMEAPSLRED